jgi:hypothetical protein
LLFVQIQNFNHFPLGDDSTSERFKLLRVKMSMKRTNRIGIAWILLACAISIVWGFSIGQAKIRWVDFKGVYYGTRCLLQHHNPYMRGQLQDVYRTEGGERPGDPEKYNQAVTLYVNVPTTFIFVAPFAMLPWEAAHLLWLMVTAGFFILAAILTWNLGERYAPKVSLLLLCILLANCEMIFDGGNTAGIAISLCVVAVWCFLRDRFVLAGVLCLAASLAIKPHDAGLVWLYFLLVGGAYRKRALQTLLVTVVLGLAAILWVSHVAPHWIEDWQSNISAISAHGGINEPSLDAITGRTPGMIIDLQAAMSVFQSDPRIYNAVSYMICGALLLVWSIYTLRTSFSQRRAWMALAAVVPLTMLVTYHRPWDAKLLLLTIPACAMLWAEGRPIRWMALLLSTVGIVLTADIPLTILLILTKNMQISTVGLCAQIRTLLLMEPTPLILLAMGIFYLWIYVQRDPERGLP